MPADRPLDILLTGDASNFHPTLADALCRLGHRVTVASGGCTGWMQTRRDVDIARRLPGKLGGLDLWARLRLNRRRLFSGYDIVSIASQDFVPLRPARVRALFDRLKADNRAIFYTALGTDWRYTEECLDPSTPLVVNEFISHGEPTPYYRAEPDSVDAWRRGELLSVGRHIYSNVDGAVSALWEYDVALRRFFTPDRMAYGGIPVDTSAIEYRDLPERPDRVRLFLGRHRDRTLLKGADILEAAARAVVERHPGKAELVIVENRPYAEYLGLLESSHIVLDQIYSYTPATNALLAMAMGKAAVSGGDERFYSFIGEERLRPVLHVEPDYESVERAIEQAVLHPDKLRERGRAGREFVEKHNDSLVVARRFLDFWTSRLC